MPTCSAPIRFVQVVEVVEVVLDGRRLVGLDEHPHAGDAEDAAVPPDRVDHLVRLAADVAVREGPDVRVSDQDGLLRGLEGVERRAVAAVGHVHRHPDIVHPLDDRDPPVRQAAVDPVGRAGADQVAGVIGQLRHALAEPVEVVHVVQRVEVIGVLHAEDHAGAAASRRLVEVRGSGDAEHPVSVVRDDAVDSRHPLEDRFPRPEGAGSHRVENGVDTGEIEIVPEGLGECSRDCRTRPAWSRTPA